MISLTDIKIVDIAKIIIMFLTCIISTVLKNNLNEK